MALFIITALAGTGYAAASESQLVGAACQGLACDAEIDGGLAFLQAAKSFLPKIREDLRLDRHRDSAEDDMEPGDEPINFQEVDQARSDFEGNDHLFRGCGDVLLDVGANAGTHVRKLFEPELYPHAPVLKWYESIFGPAAQRQGPFSVSGLCAFGFEANPMFVPKLKNITEAFDKQGWKATFLAPRVVWGEGRNQDIIFHIDPDVHHNSWSSRVDVELENGTSVTLKTLDLSSFVHEMAGRKTKGRVLMKMDIEGAEFKVLPAMLRQGLLCKSIIDTVLIEWHDRLFTNKSDIQAASDLKHQLADPTRCPHDQITTFVNFDDESYLMDPVPLLLDPAQERLQRSEAVA